MAEERIIEPVGSSKDSPKRNAKRKKRGKRTEHIMQGYGTISRGICHWDINKIRKWNREICKVIKTAVSEINDRYQTTDPGSPEITK